MSLAQPDHEDALQALAREIDIPKEKADEARAHFMSLGEWLERPDSGIAEYDPFIAPQGSFLLGTTNRPIGTDEKYDVDLICRMNANKSDFTQAELKRTVGVEVTAYAKAHGMTHKPEDKRRCWTLEYADGSQFHMDVLPCLPDATDYRHKLEKSGFSEFAQNTTRTAEAIAITDKECDNYHRYCDDWPSSNPLGYAGWFRERMAISLELRKAALAKERSVLAKVEDIPDHEVKTTLQKSVQLLKRHRDTMFAEDMDYRPISIILTTLAAHSYGNEERLVDALSSILRTMDRHIEDRDGEKWIANPVNPAENFADRWAEDPELEAAFDRWLEAARQDFGLYLNGARSTEIPHVLAERLGSKAVRRAVEAMTAAAVGAAAPAAPAIARVEEAVTKVQIAGRGTPPYRA